MWIKFKKGHPAFAYRPGSVTELTKDVIKQYDLNENGYVIPATEEEIAAAKAAIVLEVAKQAAIDSRTAMVDTLQTALVQNR